MPVLGIQETYSNITSCWISEADLLTHVQRKGILEIILKREKKSKFFLVSAYVNFKINI